jgi:heme exporter protein D
MNFTDGWMGGGEWIWTAVCVLMVVLLVVVITRVSKK